MNVIVTGAAGFAGYSVTKELVDRENFVYAIVKPGSSHNSRLNGLAKTGRLQLVECDCSDYGRLPDMIRTECDSFYHLAWFGNRDDFKTQKSNIDYSVSAVEAAAALNCTRFIGIGSQAEYGICDFVMSEDKIPNPFSSYGAAKTAAMYLTKNRASQLGIEWVWGRIFSLYGLYQPLNTMLPSLLTKLINNDEVNLSSCEQNWDFLDVTDAASAVAALGEKGHSGEIYNIAHGRYMPLKDYVEMSRNLTGSSSRINYGQSVDPFVSLQPDVSKIMRDTGWKPKIDFDEGIRSLADSIRATL